MFKSMRCDIHLARLSTDGRRAMWRRPCEGGLFLQPAQLCTMPPSAPARKKKLQKYVFPTNWTARCPHVCATKNINYPAEVESSKVTLQVENFPLSFYPPAPIPTPPSELKGVRPHPQHTKSRLFSLVMRVGSPFPARKSKTAGSVILQTGGVFFVATPN